MRRTVVFITDYGTGGGGAIAGVVKSVCSDLDVYDATHAIEPYNIRQAAYELSAVVPYWPAETFFVVVVDPRVGSNRRSCVARLANGCFVVTPDNGTLTMVVDQIEEVRRIDEARHRLPGSENVHIFAGRDIFAYTAARLAADMLAFEEVGPLFAPAEVKRLSLTSVSARLGAGWAEGGIYNFDTPYGSARINVANGGFQRIAGFCYGDQFRAVVTDGRRVVYEGIGCYGRTFDEAKDLEANLVGDIQPGEAQMLRFNTRGGFIQTYAPEVLRDAACAVGWRVRFEQLDG